MNAQSSLGATYHEENGKTNFLVWAPFQDQLELKLLSPGERVISMQREENGYHFVELENAPPGTRYKYILNQDRERPDPVSRYQPEGVHGPSEVLNLNFHNSPEQWKGLPLQDYIIYELHIGTFTPQGTFESAIEQLDALVELGVTAIEIMPVSQFPGERNWGYDGVYPFAPQNTYGGPQGLSRLIRACHDRGLAVILDVVYNHFGPEGNYLAEYAPYFTEKYRTPWGTAINFDGPWSDEVRRYFIENTMMWLFQYEFDALRYDAVHAILDSSALPFLEELTALVHEEAQRRGRLVYLIAESDLNDTRIIRPRYEGGFNMDAQWCDDFHHSVHSLVTGERSGYYSDFGTVQHLAKAYHEGFVMDGQFSGHRKRRHGNPSRERPAEQFVVCIQNHDQVGNRMFGDRFSTLISLEARKLAATAYLLSPFIPMIFMGEEYSEPAPFPYFISHGDPDLVEAVRRGRKEEFSSFQWQGEPPDPQAEQTFQSAKLNHALRNEGEHKAVYEFYRELLQLRKTIPALKKLSKKDLIVETLEEQPVMIIHRGIPPQEAVLFLNFSQDTALIKLENPKTRWQKRLDSAAERWAGPGSSLEEVLGTGKEVSIQLQPTSAALYVRT
ncbi:MAG: malto-oligosyltrehalose trehalohydrolase [bacterium]|jgi:maltooligosyltrehalose trehalohydrolase